MALIQEPWVHGNQVRGLGLKGYNIFYSRENGGCRTCILAKRNINVLMLNNYSSRDLTVVRMEGKTHHCWMASAYMPYDDPSQPPPDAVKMLISAAETQDINLLLGCDANAHHTIWGSTNINERGESLFNYLLETNLLICNRGSEPTFITVNRREVLDLTLITKANCFRVTNWRVSEQASLSDHCWILFEVQFTIEPHKSFRNIRRTNWKKFSETVRANMGSTPTAGLLAESAVDTAVNAVTGVLYDAFLTSCPVSRATGKSRPPWWNPDLGRLRETTRRLFNAAKDSGDEGDWSRYKESLRSFKRSIRLAKRTSWRNFCESIEGSAEASRLRRVLSGTPSSPSSIRGEDGAWTTTNEGLLNTLLNTHFPGCEDAASGVAGPIRRPNVGENWDLITSIVDDRSTAWAVRSFDPLKSSGLDGLRPIMLQKALEHITPWLVLIFRSCLWLGYVPLAWREVRVVFIPKAGKAGHTVAKDYRPISLSSFMLKTLERLLDIHIRGAIQGNCLSKAQHAYTKGRSVDTALHAAVSIIERSLEYGEYTLGAFLDIEGAFNNVKTDAIYNRLLELGINRGLCDWIESMLHTRTISSDMGGFTARKTVKRGTPEGGGFYHHYCGSWWLIKF